MLGWRCLWRLMTGDVYVPALDIVADFCGDAVYDLCGKRGAA
jgi:hypothetical protein